MSFFASSAESLLFGMVTTTTCSGATRGGRTKPLLSPWTMMATPMVRVVHPQEFCHTMLRPPFLFSYSIWNILAKFWPRQCDVAPWMPRPVWGTKASTVVV